MSKFAGLLSEPHGSIGAMPYTPESGWEWEVPAVVRAVIDGASFLVDLDLGWGVHKLEVVICEGIEVDEVETPDGMAARKEAQRLMTDALLTVRCVRMTTSGSVCEIAYSPWFVPRSEQGSFKSAMLASGYARKIE